MGIACGSGMAAASAAERGAGNADAILFTRKPGESDTGFVHRNAPSQRPVRLKTKSGEPDTTFFGKPDLVHGPIAAKWNSTPVIIALYEDSVFETRLEKTYVDHNRFVQVEGYVFAATGQPNRYRRLAMGSIEPAGGNPEIESVFFANADRDNRKELAVLVKWEQLLHPGSSGEDYGAFFYDDLSTAGAESLAVLSATAEKVGVSSNSFDRDGARLGTYRYRSAAEVKSRLKQLGF
jgi:hypothetical protein